MQRHLDFPPIEIVKAQGSYLYPKSGQPLLDGISSWWTNLHGHSHPAMVKALSQQLEQLDHVMLAGLTHEPISQLAEQLVALTPAPLQKAFFADSGAAAVEVALKMSLQYWHQVGETKRTRFISLEQGYHGETLGSLAVTDIPLFREQYGPLLIQHHHAPSPDLTQKSSDESEAEFILSRLNAMSALLTRYQDEICAIIVEPLVQGAAGMKMYPPTYLTQLAQLAQAYRVHLIFDEIAVGFGRTGTLFALEQTGICPDFLCLSKGLTGGLLPMSCVLTTQTVYEAFLSDHVSRGFLHSHSFTGNPLAARAALTSLALFEQEDTLNQIKRLSKQLKQWLTSALPEAISAPRVTGLIGAFTVENTNADFSATVTQLGAKRGIWIRPIGNHVYVMPPYSITSEELQRLLEVSLQCSLEASSSGNQTTQIALP